MTNFCLNTLCLKYNSEYDENRIQNVLDKTLIFLTETWQKHKKLTQHDLRLYVDVNPGQIGIFNYKEYYNTLRQRAKFGYSSLRNLLIALSKIQTFAPYYTDPSFEDESLDNLCNKKVHLEFDISRTLIPNASNYQPDATIFYFAFERQMILLSLAIQHCWEKEKICFVVLDDSNESQNCEVENICVHAENKNAVEQKFFPYSILDEGYFKRTGHKCQGQEIYIELRTCRYWCLDNKHKDHYEVFSSTFEHLGVADITTYVLDNAKAVPGRNIKSEFS